MASQSSSKLLALSKQISSFVRRPYSFYWRDQRIAQSASRLLSIDCRSKLETSDIRDEDPATLRQDVKDIFKEGVRAALPDNLLKVNM